MGLGHAADRRRGHGKIGAIDLRIRIAIGMPPTFQPNGEKWGSFTFFRGRLFIVEEPGGRKPQNPQSVQASQHYQRLKEKDLMHQGFKNFNSQKSYYIEE
jgi:hypothetical protein